MGLQPGRELQHEEEAVRRRARAPGAVARDRPLGRRAGAAEDRAGAPRRRRPAARLRSRDASEKELVKLSGLLARHQRVARARRASCSRKPASENLTFKLTNRNVAMPYTPVGVFLIDQWRQIGVTVQARAARDAALPRRAAARQPDLRRGARLQLRLHGRAQPAAAEVPLARPLGDQLRAADRPQARRALRQAVGRARQEEALRAAARVREARARAGVHRSRRSGGTASSSTTSS